MPGLTFTLICTVPGPLSTHIATSNINRIELAEHSIVRAFLDLADLFLFLSNNLGSVFVIVLPL